MLNIKTAGEFWSALDKSSECWLVPNSKPGKYSRVIYRGVLVRAHRLAWELANGKPLPQRMCGCHHCDNPPCVNPEHIFAGTPQDNAIDCSLKGRHRGRNGVPQRAPLDPAIVPWYKAGKIRRARPRKDDPPIFRKHYRRIDEIEVRKMRRDHEQHQDCYEIAKHYHRSVSTVRDILKRRTWAHVEQRPIPKTTFKWQGRHGENQ